MADGRYGSANERKGKRGDERWRTISLRTPARVRTRPDPTAIKKTAATYPIAQPENCISHTTFPFIEGSGTHVQSKRNPGIRNQHESSDPSQVVERLESLNEDEEDKVDGGADRGVVVEGDEGVHLIIRSMQSQQCYRYQDRMMGMRVRMRNAPSDRATKPRS